MTFPEYVCETCGMHSPDWGMCVTKGLGAWRGHDWVRLPDCYACDDTGYEPGEGLYCTFCKKGCAVAMGQMKAGINPWGDSGEHKSEGKEGATDR